ncbi:hypothetical protein ZIOFF_018604 [Zingiber officinale]|uniref:Uncharacterized protein n=1 Tax=Zingiber officinale TaxID=94328 RepID=A0A8J5HGM2_ZINOF|nr:hypothetical protein ZIOFF_018604 [Zingiber officinale]
MFGGTACMEDYLGKYSQDSQRNNASLNGYSAFVSRFIFIRKTTCLLLEEHLVLVRKLGEIILPSIIPILTQGVKHLDSSRRQEIHFLECLSIGEFSSTLLQKGVSIGLSEVMASAACKRMQGIDEKFSTPLHALEDDETSDIVLDGLKQILSAFNAYAVGAIAEDVQTSVKKASVIVVLVINEEDIDSLISDSLKECILPGFAAWEALGRVVGSLQKDALSSFIKAVRDALEIKSEDKERYLFFSMKETSRVVVFESWANGAVEMREQAALGLGELIALTNLETLKEFVIPVTGYALLTKKKNLTKVIFGKKFPPKLSTLHMELINTFPLLRNIVSKDALKDSLKDEKVGTLLDFWYSLLSGYHPPDQGIKLLSLVGTLLDFWYSWFSGYCPPDQRIKFLSPSRHYWTSVIILPTKGSNSFLLSRQYWSSGIIDFLVIIRLSSSHRSASGVRFDHICIEPYAIASPRLNDHSCQKSTSDGSPSMPDDNIKSSMRRLSILQSSETNSKETKSLLGRLFE